MSIQEIKKRRDSSGNWSVSLSGKMKREMKATVSYEGV